ncbi:MAG: response regulator [bacterium]|nr:response regulator [bacterium]
MKRIVQRRPVIAVAVALVLFLGLNYTFQAITVTTTAVENSKRVFDQIDAFKKNRPEWMPEETKAQDLNNLLGLLGSDESVTVLAAEPNGKTIFAANQSKFVGKTLTSLHIEPKDYLEDKNGFWIQMDTGRKFCYFEMRDGMILGRMIGGTRMFNDVNINNMLLMFFALIIFAFALAVIVRYLDRNIVRTVRAISEDIAKVAEGDFEVKFETDATIEFQQISESMNRIQMKLRDLTFQKEQLAIRLKEAKDKEEQAVNAKEKFISQMTHSIRTPLNGIVGMTTIAEAYIDDIERVTDALGKIDVSCKHLIALLNQSVAISEGNLSEINEDTAVSSDLVEQSMLQLSDFRAEYYSEKRILLVEDNELGREIATEVLGLVGIHVEQACDGQQAVSCVSQSPEHYYDMILMDIQMPVMDGYIATRIIRGMEREDVKTMPIVAMTACTLASEVKAVKEAGMNEYLAKPLELDKLKYVLMKWL